jgi:hypothetical protein
MNVSADSSSTANATVETVAAGRAKHREGCARKAALGPQHHRVRQDDQVREQLEVEPGRLFDDRPPAPLPDPVTERGRE